MVKTIKLKGTVLCVRGKSGDESDESDESNDNSYLVSIYEGNSCNETVIGWVHIERVSKSNSESCRNVPLTTPTPTP